VFGNDSLGTRWESEVRVFTIKIPPIITINSPNLNDTFGALAPNFNISITELNLDTMWYTIDGGTTNIIFYSFIGTINQTEWDKLDTGPVIIEFYTNDSLGLTGYAEVSINKDIDEPFIIINTPNSNDFYSVTSPDFDISITESNLDTMWYTIDGGTSNIIFYSFIGTIDQTEWDKLDTGPVIIEFYANDSLGLTGYAEVSINKDIDEPFITINTPNSNDFYSVISPDFDISITELNLDTIWYTIDGGITNITFYSFIGTIDQTEWNKLDSGPVIMRFYANDSLGLIGFAEVSFNKDIDEPFITINSPDFNEEFRYPPGFSISIDESNLDTFWYTIDGGQTNITITEFTGVVEEEVWNSAESGTLTIKFYARDEAGNIGYNDVIIVKLTPSSGGQSIPGFNLLIMLSIFGMVSLFFIRKRFKKNLI